MSGVTIGVDPGKHGAVAVLDSVTGLVLATQNFSATRGDEKAIALLHAVAPKGVTDVFIEQVHSSPQMGVVSAFSFGENFGWWLGVTQALGLKTTRVSPQTWMSALGCMTGGDKHVSLRKAEKVFGAGRTKVTLQNADALLIAYYGVRVRAAMARSDQGGNNG